MVAGSSKQMSLRWNKADKSEPKHPLDKETLSSQLENNPKNVAVFHCSMATYDFLLFLWNIQHVIPIFNLHEVHKRFSSVFLVGDAYVQSLSDSLHSPPPLLLHFHSAPLSRVLHLLPCWNCRRFSSVEMLKFVWFEEVCPPPPLPSVTYTLPHFLRIIL